MPIEMARTQVKRIRKLMRSRGLLATDLARAAGISTRTLDNVLYGSSSSRIARQRITDLLGQVIWKGIYVSGRFLRLPAGSEMEFESHEEATEAALEFGANVVLKGKSICFVIPTRVVVQLPAVRGAGPCVSGFVDKKRNREISASSERMTENKKEQMT